jgi:hypothetical protein
MGLIRKAASVSTLGGVKFTSRREAETKERLANARLAKAERKALKKSGDDEPKSRPEAPNAAQASARILAAGISKAAAKRAAKKDAKEK